MSTATQIRTPVLPAPTPIACAHGLDTLLALWGTGLAPSTHRTYANHLRRFATFLGIGVDELPHTLCTADRGPAYAALRRYRGALLARGCAPSTVNCALAAMRSLVAVARAAGLLEWSIDLPSVRVVAYRDTRGPSRAAVAALLAQTASQRSPWRAARDHLVVRLLNDLALRCQEVVSLRDCDIEWTAAGPEFIWVLGKGYRDRVRLTLPQPCRMALNRWQEARTARDVTIATTGLKTTRVLVELSPRGVAKMLERHSIRLGLPVVNPHSIRHGSITRAFDAGHSVQTIRSFSRHRRLDTLLLYHDNRLGGADIVAASVSNLFP